MVLAHFIAGLIALGLLAYLFVALLNPERFS
jgi:K+-transporting ATPase KdpF subunit